MSRILVVWRKSRWVSRFGDFAADDFLESVYALAGGVGGVHEMHFGGSGWEFGVMRLELRSRK